jgi:putative pyruvate formate lyase activating enzyme
VYIHPANWLYDSLQYLKILYILNKIMIPLYRTAYTSGVLGRAAMELSEALHDCTLCPRKCHVNRHKQATGTCKTGSRALVSSYGPHVGEEGCLVGHGGSGTIFFTHCNLRCSFCQNYEISHLGDGKEVSESEIAAMMLDLQMRGCHNINFVTPSHVVPQMVMAIERACEQGLRIPIVYNSSGYDSVETLRQLEGIIDIYMPDLKFSRKDTASETCNAPDYFDVARAAVREMQRQVGELKVDDKGIARRGLLIRHLVMPGDAAGTELIMEFLANEISKDTALNIMPQYRPCGDVVAGSELDRPVTMEEFRDARETAKAKGLRRLL